MLCSAEPRVARRFETGSSVPSEYRVQFLDFNSNDWRVYARFGFRGEADACLDALQQRGIEARLVTADGAN